MLRLLRFGRVSLGAVNMKSEDMVLLAAAGLGVYLLWPALKNVGKAAEDATGVISDITGGVKWVTGSGSNDAFTDVMNEIRAELGLGPLTNVWGTTGYGGAGGSW